MREERVRAGEERERERQKVQKRETSNRVCGRQHQKAQRLQQACATRQAALQHFVLSQLQ